MNRKKDEAASQLPENLRPVYEKLVADYQDAVFSKTGKRFVSYDVLAKLVLAGWRKSGEDSTRKVNPTPEGVDE